jgi:Rrf2 family protein
VLKITRKIEYSLSALRHIASKHQGELTTAKEVCDRYGAPFDVLSKVLQTLAQKGVLKSEQGAYGGYLLQKDLSKVSFYDLAEMIEGPMAVVKCLHSEAPKCDLSSTCNVVSPLTYFNEKLIEFYQSLSVL